MLAKKILDKEGDWECIKEVLVWIIDIEAGMVALPERNLQAFRDLQDILTYQRRMGRKKLERLVWKLRSIHLVVLGVVAHLYHIQRVLSQAGMDRAWLYPDFHREIADWNMLADQTSNRPTHLDEIVRHEPTHLGFCNASGLGAGGVWIDPSHLGKYLVWHHPWPADIIANLIYSMNREGKIRTWNLPHSFSTRQPYLRQYRKSDWPPLAQGRMTLPPSPGARRRPPR